MKKFIYPVAFGLLCCTALIHPASASVTGDFDSINLVFTNTSGSTATATTTFGWTITNGNSTSATTTCNYKLFYTQSYPTPNYMGWQDNKEQTTVANDTKSYSHPFVCTVYANYAVNNEFVAKGELLGVAGTPGTKIIEQTKRF